MIRPLRARHARVVRALAIALPVGIAAALWAREDEALGPLPEEVASAGPSIEAPMHASDDAWGELPLTMRVGRTEGRVVVELEPRERLRLPDLLVYWTAEGTDGDALPADAYLLGALGESARAYALPANAGAGWLVLYSVARSQVVDAAALPR